MIFAIVISHLIVASVANPLHKYPFVFLLDVGNEELEKTNTEQIRLSIPGGSLALRYPAIAESDLITHIRVSGIDFGTDLKANILDGGPGYKYVVLVFSGNKGLPYDAVVTIETVSSNQDLNKIDQNPTYKINSANTITVKESDGDDVNNSAEDMDNNNENTVETANNNEIVEPSSNVYKYEEIPEDDKTVDESSHSKESEYYDNEDSNNREKDLNEGTIENKDDDKGVDSNENQYRAERLQAESDNAFEDNNKDNLKSLDDEAVNQDKSLDPDARMYEQDSTNDAQGHNEYSAEDAVELDQMFNDEEIHNDGDKYKDSNNNNFDSDYDFAISY